MESAVRQKNKHLLRAYITKVPERHSGGFLSNVSEWERRTGVNC